MDFNSNLLNLRFAEKGISRLENNDTLKSHNVNLCTRNTYVRSWAQWINNNNVFQQVHTQSTRTQNSVIPIVHDVTRWNPSQDNTRTTITCCTSYAISQEAEKLLGWGPLSAKALHGT